VNLRMDERLCARLAARLASGPVVLASVLDTRGATPRKRGARMLIGPDFAELSVGGGEAEARVLLAARELLAQRGGAAAVEIDLSGGEGAAGICGGRMRIALRRWQGEDDLRLARGLSSTLQGGKPAILPGASIGNEAEDARLLPDIRLLIVGAGHCGRALFELARFLDFDLWVQDERPACFEDEVFAGARVLCGPAELLRQALDTPRRLYAVLLTRDFRRDLEALAVLAERPPAFLGMMGSRRRVAQVLEAAPEAAHGLAITAPVGLDLGEQSPHEIAVSILAQLVAIRAQR
jgi:xanthine dehydrogenase accessory factor